MISKKDLLLKSKALTPIIRIGKNGLSQNVYSELDKLLKKRHLVKLKILKNCSISKSVITESILQHTGAEVIDEIGNTLTIFRTN